MKNDFEEYLKKCAQEDCYMKHMRLENIKIRDSYANSIPTEYKMNVCRQYWNKTHKQDRYIVVDHNNYLLDGYIQYLVLKENNINVAEVKISNKKRKRWSRKNRQTKKQRLNKVNYRECNTTYIYGVHPNSNSTKERVWRVPNSWWNGWAENLNIGDMLLVKKNMDLHQLKLLRLKD